MGALRHVGVSAYFSKPALSPHAAKALSDLLVDSRWPWAPSWVRFSGVHKKHDSKKKRIGGTSGVASVMEGLADNRLATLYASRATNDPYHVSVLLDIERDKENWGYEAAFRLLLVCQMDDLPSGKSFSSWLTLAHGWIATVGALNAVVGVWPTLEMAIADTWLTHTVVDSPPVSRHLGLPKDFDLQTALLARWLRFLGRTYARHPRWGTYLNAAHLAAIGGVERIQAEVAPAVITPLGELTYLQLTPSIETAMSPEAEQKRQALEALMTPILLGAPRPTPTSPPASP